LGLTLLGRTAARAQPIYSIQPIIKLGDQAGSVPLQAQDGYFDIGTLNDSGQIIFTATDSPDSEALIQYNGGTFMPIVSRGATYPGGTWPQNVRVMPTVQMNQTGSAVFAAGVFDATGPQFDSFLWDGRSKQVAPIAARGQAVAQNGALVGTGMMPVINNKNEMVLSVKVGQAAGQPQYGLFFSGSDGSLKKIVAPGDTLPDGKTVAAAGYPDLNDAGVVAFEARGVGDNADAWSAYTWADSTITPIGVVGQRPSSSVQPANIQIASIASVWLNNNNNNSALIEANINSPTGPVGLFRFSGGQLTPLAVPNQRMPDGGILRNELGPSYANELGQHAFVAELADGSTAAYLIDTSDALSTILKSGTTTPLGTITSVGMGSGGASFGIGLNSKGQVAVTLGINGGVDTLALLTPQ
jgi:hypothetical protein